MAEFTFKCVHHDRALEGEPRWLPANRLVDGKWVEAPGEWVIDFSEFGCSGLDAQQKKLDERFPDTWDNEEYARLMDAATDACVSSWEWVLPTDLS